MCRINWRGATDPIEAGLCPEVVYLRAEQPPLEHIRVFSQPRYKSGVYFFPLLNRTLYHEFHVFPVFVTLSETTVPEVPQSLINDIITKDKTRDNKHR